MFASRLRQAARSPGVSGVAWRAGLGGSSGGQRASSIRSVACDRSGSGRDGPVVARGALAAWPACQGGVGSRPCRRWARRLGNQRAANGPPARHARARRSRVWSSDTTPTARRAASKSPARGGTLRGPAVLAASGGRATDRLRLGSAGRSPGRRDDRGGQSGDDVCRLSGGGACRPGRHGGWSTGRGICRWSEGASSAAVRPAPSGGPRVVTLPCGARRPAGWRVRRRSRRTSVRTRAEARSDRS
jgi:hypothetical protein